MSQQLHQSQLNPNMRLKHVDSLRGIAALLVILLHVSESFIKLSDQNHALIYDVAWYINTGRIGVVIFFAISGFVLLKSIKALKPFLIKRFFRLYPAFWLSLVLSIVFIHHQFPSLSTLFANISMLPLMFDKEVMIGVYWTLETELIFYVLGVLIFVMGFSQSPIFICLASLFFLIVFILLVLINFTAPNHTGLNVMPYHLSIMFWGGLYRHLYDKPLCKIRIVNFQISLKILFLLLTLAVFFMPLASLFKGLYFSEFKSIQFGLANILGLVTFIVLTGYIKITNRFMVWLGTISYSLYLFHPIVFSAFLDFCNKFLPSALTQINLFSYLLLNIILTVFLCGFIYRWVEKPSMAFAKKWSNQYN
ncbi:MAG: acyltransferase family protein [Marinicellaceae bacterium]